MLQKVAAGRRALPAPSRAHPNELLPARASWLHRANLRRAARNATGPAPGESLRWDGDERRCGWQWPRVHVVGTIGRFLSACCHVANILHESSESAHHLTAFRIVSTSASSMSPPKHPPIIFVHSRSVRSVRAGFVLSILSLAAVVSPAALSLPAPARSLHLRHACARMRE